MEPFASLGALLEAHGLTGVPEETVTHTGFSGAMLTRLRSQDGGAFILKRMSVEHDWIMRATDDVSCREAVLAASAPDLGDRLRTPAIGTARDGDAYVVLMHDISRELVPPGAITELQFHLVIDRMADLHARPAPAGIPWCNLERRVTLLKPAGARIAEAYGAAVAVDIAEGWHLFDELAPGRASDIVRALLNDSSPLISALGRMPTAFLHGDLKLDNIGLDGAGRMWLLDWAMTLVAPPAVELGWFMAINSRRLPVSLDEALARYSAVTRMAPTLRARHDALTILCGMLLRGWRKALDAASGESAELRWWCEQVEAAADFL